MAIWNVQSILLKWPEVIKGIEKFKSDITALTYTKKKGSEGEKVADFLHIYSGVPKKESNKEVSCLIRKQLKKYVINYETVN